jgi:hypothetical protein
VQLHIVDAPSVGNCRPEAQARLNAFPRPWRAAPLHLEGAGVELWHGLSGPIIDHKGPRERALKACAKVRTMCVRHGIRFTHRQIRLSLRH